MKTTNARTFLRAAVLLAVAVSGGNKLAQAQLTTIHSFTNTNGDGENPYQQALAVDKNGALYGTAGLAAVRNGVSFSNSCRPQSREAPGRRT